MRVDLLEAEHDPTKVLKAMSDLNKEKTIREDNRRSIRRGAELASAGVGKSDKTNQTT